MVIVTVVVVVVAWYEVREEVRELEKKDKERMKK